MIFRNKQNIQIIFAITLLLIGGCFFYFFLLDILGPPETPPIPKWAYSRKYLKPAGMLPEAIPWAQAFWTHKNRLFVTGRSLDHPSGWARYYARQRGWRVEQVAPLWDPVTGKSIPLKARGYEKNQRNAASSQFPDGKLLLSYVTGEFIRKSLHWTHVVYDPDTDTRQSPSPQPIPNEGILYNLVALKGNRYLYVKYEPIFFKWHDIQKPHLLLIEGDINKNTETVVMDIQTPHHGKLIPTPDREHLFFVVNNCSDPNGSVMGIGDGHVSPCSYIDYIDLKKKTFKTVGSFVGESYKKKDGNVEVQKNGFGLQSIAMDENRLFAFGGKNSHGLAYKSIELFDLSTKKTQIVGDLSEELQRLLWVSIPQGMVRLSDGSVVVGTARALYLYNQKSKKFSKIDELILPRGEYALTVSPDDKVYIVGGFNYHGDPRLIEMFDYKAYLKNK